MQRGQQGEFITVSTTGGEEVRSFLPNPLPPDPPLELDYHLQELLDKSILALGGLNTISAVLPDPALFIYMYVRKEAVLSSQIEGTQSSLSELLLFENDETVGLDLDDVKETSNYVAALNHGLKRIAEGFPLSLRLLREIHAVLLRSGRGKHDSPGEFRRSQNWIGGSRPGNAVFVPPPHGRVMQCMGDLEKFLHGQPVQVPILIRAALAHLQFETIHPFLDGNGRLGRLLITLLLCAEGFLKQPLLYLSLFLKAHKQDYYDLLQEVRLSGDWEKWLEFFLTGVEETASNAAETAETLVNMLATHREAIQTAVGRGAGSALRVHHALRQRPITSVAKLASATGLAVPTVTRALGNLISLGLVNEVTGNRYARIFVYTDYLETLKQGTEL